MFLGEHQVLGFLEPCVSSAHPKCALFPPLAPENLTQTGFLYVLHILLIIITLNILSRNQALPPEFNFNIFLHSLYILNLLLKPSKDGATFYALDIILDSNIFHTQPMQILMINTDPK